MSGKNVRLQLMLESVETQLWVTKAVRQRIPSRRQQQNADDQNPSVGSAVRSTSAECSV